jgi:putative intracellular protease/amidase
MSSAPAIQRVAVVLFDGFTVLDVSGPVHAFARCRVQHAHGTRQPLFELCSMGERAGAVKPGEGPPSYAEYGFADAPDYDILLIPGGFGTRTAVNDGTFLKHLAEASRRTTITTTVCTGSALLARTGLLDNRPATSNKIAWDWVVQQGPRVKWMRKARWVDDGNIVTSSGVSAGIDMATEPDRPAARPRHGRVSGWQYGIPLARGRCRRPVRVGASNGLIVTSGALSHVNHDTTLNNLEPAGPSFCACAGVHHECNLRPWPSPGVHGGPVSPFQRS